MIVVEEKTLTTIFYDFLKINLYNPSFSFRYVRRQICFLLIINGKEFYEMGFARKDVEATKKLEKKFVRYPEGAEKYSLGLTKFQALAKEAKAVYKIDKVALVNCEIFEKYLETFREY